MKKKLNEGLMDSIVSGIMTWAVQRDIAKDPEFQQKMSSHRRSIEQLSKEIEDTIQSILKKKNPKK